MSLATIGLALPAALPARGAPVARTDPLLSRYGYALFLAAAAYLVAPLLEVPFWGVSWSTPLLLLVMAELLVRRPGPRWEAYSSWIALAGLLWGGQFVSLLGNVFAGEITAVCSSDLAWLLRYGLWMTVFVLTIVLVSRPRLGPLVVTVLGLAVLALALARWSEVWLYGTVGPGKSVFLTPNGYGWGFSAFLPLALFLAFTSKGAAQLGLFSGLLAALVAIALNGSRSSWITVAVGATLTVSWLFLAAGRGRLGRLLLGLAALALSLAVAVFVLPESLGGPVKKRAQTLRQLDRDKSLLVRQLMTQKAVRLFEESPVFGVGPGRFRKTSVLLDIPPALRHRTEDQHNRRSAHNAYAALLAETGLVGTLPFLVLALVLLVGGARAAWRHSRRGELWAIPVYAGFAGMCLHLWSLSGLTGTAAWFVMGLVAALVHREAEMSRLRAARVGNC